MHLDENSLSQKKQNDGDQHTVSERNENLKRARFYHVKNLRMSCVHHEENAAFFM